MQQISGVATPLAVTDAQPWVTLLCKFPDVAAEPQPLSYFSMMLSNATGRLDDYWREVSYNKINIVGSQAYGWFTLPHPRSYYVPADANCSSSRANLDALFADCTGVADATVNFSPFVGINTMYNEELDGCAWGGGEYATLDGVHKLWYTTWEPPWGYTHEAPLAHEMGHGFGLPHANNSDGDGDTYDNPWDVMSDSWDNATGSAVGTYGWLPKHLNVWSRDKLGWIDAARKLTISTNGLYSDIVLDRASLIGSTNRQMIVVTLPSPQPATPTTRSRHASASAPTRRALPATPSSSTRSIRRRGSVRRGALMQPCRRPTFPTTKVRCSRSAKAGWRRAAHSPSP